MKKYIYSFLILMMSCLVMVSCGDDDAAASKGAPAIGSAGTYTGTWTIINETKGTSYNIPGSVVLAQKDELAYVTNISTKIRVIKTDLFTGEEEKIDVTFVGKKEE